MQRKFNHVCLTFEVNVLFDQVNEVRNDILFVGEYHVVFMYESMFIMSLGKKCIESGFWNQLLPDFTSFYIKSYEIQSCKYDLLYSFEYIINALK